MDSFFKKKNKHNHHPTKVNYDDNDHISASLPPINKTTTESSPFDELELSSRKILTHSEIEDEKNKLKQRCELVQQSDMDQFGKSIEELCEYELFLRKIAVPIKDPKTKAVSHFDVAGKIYSKSDLQKVFQFLQQERRNLEQQRIIYRQNILELGKELVQNATVITPKSKEMPVQVEFDVDNKIEINSKTEKEEGGGGEKSPSKTETEIHAKREIKIDVESPRPRRSIRNIGLTSSKLGSAFYDTNVTLASALTNPFVLLSSCTKFTRNSIRALGNNINFDTYDDILGKWENFITGKQFMARDSLSDSVYDILDKHPYIKESLKPDINGYTRDLKKCVFIPIHRKHMKEPSQSDLGKLRDKDAWRIWSYPLNSQTDLCYDIVDLYEYIQKFEGNASEGDVEINIQITNPAWNVKGSGLEIQFFEPEDIYEAKKWYHGYKSLQTLLTEIKMDDQTKQIMSNLAKDPNSFWLTKQESDKNANPGILKRTLRYINQSLHPIIYSMIFLIADWIRTWFSSYCISQVVLAKFIDTPKIAEHFDVLNGTGILSSLWRTFTSSLIHKFYIVISNVNRLWTFSDVNVGALSKYDDMLTRGMKWSYTKIGKLFSMSGETVRNFFYGIEGALKVYGYLSFLPNWISEKLQILIPLTLMHKIYTGFRNVLWRDARWDILKQPDGDSIISSYIDPQNTWIMRGNKFSRILLKRMFHGLNWVIFDQGEKSFYRWDKTINTVFKTLDIFYLATSIVSTLYDGVYYYLLTRYNIRLNVPDILQTDLHVDFSHKRNIVNVIIQSFGLDESRELLKKQADEIGGVKNKVMQVIIKALQYNLPEGSEVPLAPLIPDLWPVPFSKIPLGFWSSSSSSSSLKDDKQVKIIWNIYKNYIESGLRSSMDFDTIYHNSWKLFYSNPKLDKDEKLWGALIEHVSLQSIESNPVTGPEYTPLMTFTVDEMIDRSSIFTVTNMLKQFPGLHKIWSRFPQGHVWGEWTFPMNFPKLREEIKNYFELRIHAGSSLPVGEEGIPVKTIFDEYPWKWRSFNETLAQVPIVKVEEKTSPPLFLQEYNFVKDFIL